MNEFVTAVIEKSGKNKADIARALDVTPQAVGSLVGTPYPRPNTLAKLLRVCGWSTDDIRKLTLVDVYGEFLVEDKP